MKTLLLWHGRIGRAKFFAYTFGVNVLSAVSALIVSFLPGAIFPRLLTIAVYILFSYLGICLVVQRLHDLNKPGWYYLAFVATMLTLYYLSEAFSPGFMYVSMILALFFITSIYCFQGTDGDNPYGPDPVALSIPAASDEPTPE